MSNGTTPPKKRGCLFYGCLSIAIVGVVLALMLCIGLYVGNRALNKAKETYTDTSPQTIESVSYEPAERAALQSRLDAFVANFNKGEGGSELILTANDLNVLIGEDRNLKGKLFVELDEDQIKGKFAMPLPDFGPFKLKGRYLNGSGGLRVTLENGQLDVRPNSVEVRGKPIPDRFLIQLKKINLAEEFAPDPKQTKELEKVKSLQIKDGKVIIRGK